MIVENEYRIKLSDINRENKATNKAILSYLEDVGGKHSDLAGYGILDIPKTHLSWVLLEWKLKVIRRPNYTEKVKVLTWSKDAVKFYTFRDFEVYDENGELIILASSKWVLLDVTKGKIVRIEPEIISKYEPELNRKAFEDEEFEKIKEPENEQFETEYTARRADIDINQHIHNLNYIEIANEVLPEDVYRNQHLDNVRITYKKEIKFGETVKCKYAFEDGKHIVSIKSLDDKILHAIIEMY